MHQENLKEKIKARRVHTNQARHHSTLVEFPEQLSTTSSAWASNRPMKKRPEHYSMMQEKYIDGNVLLTIPEALDAVTTKTISLLITDTKTRKLIRVSRETTKEVLKTSKYKPRSWPSGQMPCGASCWQQTKRQHFDYQVSRLSTSAPA